MRRCVRAGRRIFEEAGLNAQAEKVRRACARFLSNNRIAFDRRGLYGAFLRGCPGIHAGNNHCEYHEKAIHMKFGRLTLRHLG